MKVICVDDSNRPNDIPENEWIVKGEHYTVDKVINNLKEGRGNNPVAKCFKLKEVKISNPKYAGYHIRRFTPAPFGDDIAFTIEEQIKQEVSIGNLQYEEEVVSV